jgi:hypothetical protein
MNNGKLLRCSDSCDLRQGDLALVLDARLAKSTLFRDLDPHVHTVPS